MTVLGCDIPKCVAIFSPLLTDKWDYLAEEDFTQEPGALMAALERGCLFGSERKAPPSLALIYATGINLPNSTEIGEGAGLMPSWKILRFCSRTHAACAQGLSWWCRGLGALPLPDGQEVSYGQWRCP